MRAISRIIVALALLLGALLPAQAQTERILRFVSDIRIERNGDLVVAETIRVYAGGNEIKRGILRDFPTSYTDRDGSHIEVGFNVQSVTRDGRPETFATERLSNGYRVRIGRGDTLLPNGEHEYVITYRTTRQVGFFKDFDELYWNVTGTGWTLGIDVAEARITLPEVVPFRQTAVYTGPQGAREKNAAVIEQSPGRIVFRTTARLPPRNGLTVAAAFDKGVVIPPTEAERWALWLRDNAPIVATPIAFAALAVFLLIGWLVAGRDPRTGTMVPLFAPPDGMSAPAVRYVRQMEMDDRAFASALVDVAVRGHAQFIDKNKATGLRVIPRDGPAALPADEVAVRKALFRQGAINVVSKNHTTFQNARKALDTALKSAYADKLFNTNSGWSGLGVLLAIALCIAVLIVTVWGWGVAEAAMVALAMGAFLPAVFVINFVIRKGWPGSAGGRIVFAIAVAFAVICALGGLGAVDVATRGMLRVVPALAPLLLLPLAASAFSWMRAYTVEGRRVADQIEGFRHYLGVAERDRLNFLNPPEETPALFEKFLPYAIALDVENAWGQRFAAVLAGAAVGTAVAAQQGWYQGTSNSDWSSDPGSFANYLGSSFSETIAAAAIPPAATTSPSSGWSSSSDSSSSSSGSDGGGSSGGGGGGGGGSGW